MNPAIICAIAAVAASRPGLGDTYLKGGDGFKRFSEYGWIDRFRLIRLSRLLREDAMRTAMRQAINEKRNNARWATYFRILDRKKS